MQGKRKFFSLLAFYPSMLLLLSFMHRSFFPPLLLSLLFLSRLSYKLADITNVFLRPIMTDRREREKDSG